MTEGRKPAPAADLEALRDRLRAAQGSEYWRSLEELAGSEAFLEYLHREFPENATEWTDPVSRRKFLQLMAASLALAGMSGCAPAPAEKILPYVRAPEEMVPGKPLFYATALALGGYATGVLVESHQGRPTKIEGNPAHPASLGATDIFSQAAVLSLYDPDRSQVILNAGRISTWSNFQTAASLELEAQRQTRGAGLRLLTETLTSPTLAAQIRELLRQFPAARWHQYEPANRDNVRAGARLAFGEHVNTIYRVEKADVILSLDADFLAYGPGHLRYAREFAARRRAELGPERMNRLYVVESTPSVTGSMADHRLPVRASEIDAIAREVARRLGLAVEAEPESPAVAANRAWIEALVRDLGRRRGASLVVAGDWQPPEVHALAHAINHALGNTGTTLVYTAPVEAEPADQTASLVALAQEMDAGRVQMLVMLGGNPVFNAPADLLFGELLNKVRFRVHLSPYEDETSHRCHWHLNETHALESWSDARAFDGTLSIQQPLIAPLYGGKSVHEVLAALAGQPGRSSYDIVREHWKARLGEKDFERTWRRAVHDGLLAGSALPPRTVSLQPEYRGQGGRAIPARAAAAAAPRGFEIVFRPDPTVFDGRFANNGWLQELPKPLSKLTWDAAALMNPTTARELGLSNESLVELHYQGRVVSAPVWLLPGQAERTVTLALGYGRSRAGRVGSGVGVNAYSIRTAATPWFGAGLDVRATGRRYPLAATQLHHTMEGRNVVRAGNAEDYRRDPELFHKMVHLPAALSLYPGHKYEGYAWGMAIDLNACIGCNACVVACQAENNIPVVGKAQVIGGREMHWIRVDRYYKGGPENPETYHQPVPCMHCENAPCEVVCPVNATVHSSEGLNEMVYNRCVGTRYCANNCPYKVRRFNFLQFAELTSPTLKMLHNPNVTVRTRGVMEKCTYCVQRINAARITAEKEDRKIRDGEVVTACQAACPTEAIIFGDINDPASRVARMKAERRNYGLLTELNTQPRTSYLARLRNPNPEIKGS